MTEAKPSDVGPQSTRKIFTTAKEVQDALRSSPLRSWLRHLEWFVDLVDAVEDVERMADQAESKLDGARRELEAVQARITSAGAQAAQAQAEAQRAADSKLAATTAAIKDAEAQLAALTAAIANAEREHAAAKARLAKHLDVEQALR